MDKIFLEQLYSQKNIEKYIKIVSYNIKGLPQESLEGIATGGSVSIDGKSNVRRTCSLTLSVPVTDNFHNSNWALSTHF